MWPFFCAHLTKTAKDFTRTSPPGRRSRYTVSPALEPRGHKYLWLVRGWQRGSEALRYRFGSARAKRTLSCHRAEWIKVDIGYTGRRMVVFCS